MYRCPNCNYQTNDASNLTLAKGCCGKREYKCSSCGYSKVRNVTVGTAANRPKVIRVNSGHNNGGKR